MERTIDVSHISHLNLINECFLLWASCVGIQICFCGKISAKSVWFLSQKIICIAIGL